MVTNSKQYSKTYYANHKEKVKASAKASKQRLASLVIEAKSKPCMDCKITYPWYVMDFDHVRGKKLANVSQLIARCSKQKLLDEIAKCDVVCANCHRERTHRRQPTVMVA
jgi:hypothetical protein